VDAILEILNSVTLGAGDQEPGFEAIRTGVNTVNWKTGSARFAIMFSDEESGTNTCSQAQALEALESFGVKFSYGNSVSLTSYTPLQEATGGVFIPDVGDIVENLLPAVFIPYEEFYLDSAVSGVAADGLITGLWHLEGQSVRVVVHDAVIGDFTVSGGQLQLDADLRGPCVVGLPYRGILKSMRMDTTLNNGATQGRRRRITEVTMRFNGTQGCKFGRSLDALNEIPFRQFEDDPLAGSPRFTGEKLVNWPAGYSGDATIFVVQDQPLPCTLLGLAVKHDYFGD